MKIVCENCNKFLGTVTVTEGEAKYDNFCPRCKTKINKVIVSQGYLSKVINGSRNKAL